MVGISIYQTTVLSFMTLAYNFKFQHLTLKIILSVALFFVQRIVPTLLIYNFFEIGQTDKVLGKLKWMS